MTKRGYHVGIIRHTLFRQSEQFIWGQAQHFTGDVTYLPRDALERPVPGADARAFADSRTRAILHTVGYSRLLTDVARGAEVSHLHAHFGVEGESSLASARTLGIPHLTTLHGYDVSLTSRALVASGRPAWMRYAARRRAFLANWDTQFICVSNHVRELAARHGMDPSRAIIIPVGVNTQAIQSRPIPGNGIVVHVARLVEKKGTQYLLLAMRDIIRTHPDIQLRIVGDGPLRAQLETQSQEDGLAGNVQFLGAKTHADVLKEIESSDILCLPSVTAASGDQEGLGQVLLEAGALGRPVVATDHGGIRDAVRHERTGILVAERNPGQLTDALKALLDAPGLAAKYGAAGSELVRSNFDVVTGARRLEEVYLSSTSGLLQ